MSRDLAIQIDPFPVDLFPVPLCHHIERFFELLCLALGEEQARRFGEGKCQSHGNQTESEGRVDHVLGVPADCPVDNDANASHEGLLQETSNLCQSLPLAREPLV